MGAGMCLGLTNSLTPIGWPRLAAFVSSVSPDAFLGTGTGGVFCSQRDRPSTTQKKAPIEVLAGLLNSKS